MSMSKVHLIVANELGFYRETLACAVRLARSNAVVTTVEPESLDAEIERLEPDLVVCTCATLAMRASPRNWVELYPGGGSLSVVCVDGKLSVTNEMDLEYLLRIFDEIETLSRAERSGGQLTG